MRKVVIDSNVYIDWFNKGRFESVFESMEVVRYLSSVVAMELRAGATTPAAQKAIGSIEKTYRKAGRLIVPSATDYWKAGDVLRKLAVSGHTIRRARITNDILIALSSSAAGASVISSNKKDFLRIQEFVRGLKWVLPSDVKH